MCLSGVSLSAVEPLTIRDTNFSCCHFLFWFKFEYTYKKKYFLNYLKFVGKNIQLFVIQCWIPSSFRIPSSIYSKFLKVTSLIVCSVFRLENVSIFASNSYHWIFMIIIGYRLGYDRYVSNQKITWNYATCIIVVWLKAVKSCILWILHVKNVHLSLRRLEHIDPWPCHWVLLQVWIII